MDKNAISFLTGGVELLDELRELWEELNLLHLNKSVDFKNYYRTFTFSVRKETLVHQAEKGELHVLIACYNNTKAGYCIASLVNGTGEIDSIYIKPDFRKINIGSKLIEKSLEWIRSNDAKKIIVKVAVGNEETFGFYAKYGFAPRLTELQQIEE